MALEARVQTASKWHRCCSGDINVAPMLCPGGRRSGSGPTGGLDGAGGARETSGDIREGQTASPGGRKPAPPDRRRFPAPAQPCGSLPAGPDLPCGPDVLR